MQQYFFKWLEDYSMDFRISNEMFAPINYTNVACCIRS